MFGTATVRSLAGLLHDLTDEEVWELTLSDNRPGLKVFLQVCIQKRRNIASALTPTYKVVVDYTKSLAEMVAAGRYDWVNSDITSAHFPVTGQGQVEREIVLIHLNKVVSTEQALAELNGRNLRPITIEELLAFGATNPDFQRLFPIVGLVSVQVYPRGSRSAPCLVRDGAKRDLSLHRYDSDWREHCRFAAVSK